jgi:hypothetical protein
MTRISLLGLAVLFLIAGCASPRPSAARGEFVLPTGMGATAIGRDGSFQGERGAFRAGRAFGLGGQSPSRRDTRANPRVKSPTAPN